MSKRKSEIRREAQEIAGALLGEDKAAWAAYREAAWYRPLQQALRKARRSAGLTQQELATRLGKDQSDISRLEIGLTDRVPLGLIKAYLEACGATFELSIRDQEGRELVEGAEHEPSRLAGDIAAVVLRGLEEASVRFRGHSDFGREQDAGTSVEARVIGWEQLAELGGRPQALHEARRPWGLAEEAPAIEDLDIASLQRRLTTSAQPLLIKFPDGQEAVIFRVRQD